MFWLTVIQFKRNEICSKLDDKNGTKNENKTWSMSDFFLIFQAFCFSLTLGISRYNRSVLANTFKY